jgi:hypothetical protein
MDKYILALLFITGTTYIGAQSPSTPPPFPAGAFMPPMKTDEAMTPNLRGFGFFPCSADTKAAPGEAEVVIQIEVDPTGHVSGAKALSGPSRLYPKAIDAVNQWTFQPFEQDGKPVAKTLKVTGPFCIDMSPDPAEAKVASEFAPTFMSCLTSVSQSADPKVQVKACGKAADIVQEFDTNTRFVEKRTVYVLYSGALVRNKQYTEALASAEKAVAVVKQGHDDNSGASSAYSAKALAEAWLGDLTDANADYEESEQYERAALTSPVGESHKVDYTHQLKGLLTSHANVLGSMNRQADRDVKLEEASKL